METAIAGSAGRPSSALQRSRPRTLMPGSSNYLRPICSRPLRPLERAQLFKSGCRLHGGRAISCHQRRTGALAPTGASCSLENSLAAPRAQAVFSVSIRSSGSTRHGQCFCLGDALPIQALVPVHPVRYELFRGYAGSAASLPNPKNRVARVSRLIGISDTTAKAYGWQEGIVVRKGTFGSLHSHESATLVEWRFAVLHVHWPPPACVGQRIVSATPDASYPDRLILRSRNGR